MAPEGTASCSSSYTVHESCLSSLCASERVSGGECVCVWGALCHLLKTRYKHFAFVPCLKGPAGEGRTRCSRGGCRRMHSGS